MRPAPTAAIAWAAAVGVAAAAAAAGAARADELAAGTSGPRAVARAGAVIVSEDGGAALLLNPGALVRRSGLRVQLGVTVRDDDLSYQAPDVGGDPGGAVPGAISDRGPPTSAPYVAVAVAPDRVGAGRLVLAAAFLETADTARALPEPAPDLDPADQDRRDQIRRLFAHRHGGTALALRRRVIAAGAAARVTDWLGVGASVTLSQARLAERRFVWAGVDGVDVVGDPARDLALDLRGDGGVTLGGAAGALIAPPRLPVELAVSVSARAGDALAGPADLDRVTTGAFPRPVVDAPRGEVRLPGVVAARAGARYLGERVLAEVAGEVAVYAGDGQPAWSIAGVAVEDEAGRAAALARVPSLLDHRSHAAVRGAVDVAVVPGFLWLVAGYAYRAPGARRERWLPGHADLGGHTVAAGAEGQWSGVTLAIGYARTFASGVTVTGSERRIVNPFDAGTAAIGDGAYDQARDAFGVSVELAWE